MSPENEAFPSIETWGILFFKRSPAMGGKAALLNSFIPERGGSGYTEMRNRDLTSWEITGTFLTDRQATILGRIFQGETLSKIAEDIGISLASVKNTRKRINAKIENRTGIKPKDIYDTVNALIQLGELTYDPTSEEI